MSTDYGPLLRRALARIDELETAAARRHEPIAVVGMACRLPGAPDPAAYWDLLSEGRCALGPVPDARWPVDGSFVDAGGFVGDLRDFDARFFGISGREAATLDPQQRLLLELAWEAFEDAGVPGRSVPESTGVFVGISNIDYREGMTHEDDVDGYFSSGATPSTASGRLAYVFGTRGPAMSVDTACSSSLVSVDLAVRHLRDGSCDLALAGGVNRMVTPHESRSLTRAGMLSPTGRCLPFDAAADGYVRAEGGGLVVLKRASDVGPHDRVLGLILGSAVNQDGRSSGLTVPHGPSQQEVIRAALRDAGVEPAAVGYLEAHGTGTALGDPIEVTALGAVFAGRREPLPIGSVKAAIGHTESAAGIAGLLKVLLMLRHGVLPPTPLVTGPNPRVDWDDIPVRVASTREPWPDDTRRIAGVSSFGFSGTNAHLVVAAPPPAGPQTPAGPPPAAPRAADAPTSDAPPVPDGPDRADRAAAPVPAAGEPLLLPLSARHPQALADLADAYARRLRTAADPAALALVAAVGRSHLPWRRCAVGATVEELDAALRRPGPAAPVGQRPRVAFLFTGQGAQRPGMTAELFRAEPVFRAAVEECAGILDPVLPVPLTTLLFDSGERVHETRFTQPALVAVGYALSRLWRDWGVHPEYVLGHSVGEYTAACVAGVLTLPDALRLVAERARLMQQCPSGVMVAVRCGVAQVEPLLAGASRSAVAAVNGVGSTVLAGPEEELRPILDALADQGVTHRRLAVSHAFHSPLLAGFAEPFTAFARGVTYRPAGIPLVSNLTGTVGTPIDADYWREHALRPVLFGRGVRTLREAGVDTLVELGPEPVLLGMAGQDWPEARRLPSLRAGREHRTMLDSLARLYDSGVDIDWAGVTRERAAGRRFVAAPTYPFQRERHWALTDGAGDGRPPGPLDVVHVGWAATPLPAGPPRRFDALVVGPDAERLAGAVTLPCRTGRLTPDTRVTDVVYAAPATGGDPERTAAACTELLSIARDLAARPTPPRLVVVTRGAAADAPDPGQSALWGLVRTVQAEHPALDCLAVDLASTGDDVRPDLLAAELTAPAGHRFVRLADGRRLTFTLVPLPVPAGPSWQPPPGAVLVTGGLGALGLRLAQDLAAAGVRQLVLFGRSAPSAAAQLVVDRLRDAGVDVRLVRGDVTLEQDVQRALDEATPLAGVVHAAGVLDDGPLAEQSPQRLAAVLRVKVHGGYLLDRLSRPLSPRFFVAYSSLAAVLPTRGSGGYGAANAYLDALLAGRRAAGLPALSVAWGPWAGPGMAAGETALHEATGLRMIDPAAGTATLLALLAAHDVPARVVVAPADWARVREVLAEAAPPGTFDALAAPVDDTGSPAAPPVRIGDVTALREHVVEVVRDVLRIGGPVDDHEGFFDMGFDSLTVLELRTRLQAELGVRLPSTVAFTFPTVDRLVGRLSADLGLSDAAPPPPTTPARATTPVPHTVPAQATTPTRADPPAVTAPDADDELAAMLARVDRGYREIQGM
ncbi:SDR family NAD(P)-dependent oxidoreductase [Micromonospora sp. WMMD987]|uniref:type I polyketide synthase n=1 Tax=Micromonospora sp. WMMD987 TaxID=3016089 RepID=UPI00249A0C7D|nr:SDR family NAD(P)-dependent oxidoreductase [Micromonospora sp. WMMD987]WFE95436.1 SDR family NAD(P)-dependent oxidoreductase [Micromonospora sp. WMMD987]